METTSLTHTKLSRMENYGWGHLGITADISCSDNMQCDNIFGIDPFYIEKGNYMRVVCVILFGMEPATTNLCLITSKGFGCYL